MHQTQQQQGFDDWGQGVAKAAPPSRAGGEAMHQPEYERESLGWLTPANGMCLPSEEWIEFNCVISRFLSKRLDVLLINRRVPERRGCTF